MTEMEYKWKKLDNHPITVVEPTGEIDSAKKLEPVEEIATRDDAQHVVLLMEGVSYINSSGCGQIVSLHSTIEERGFHLFIVMPPPSVVDVLTCLGLDSILRIRESLEDVTKELESESDGK